MFDHLTVLDWGGILASLICGAVIGMEREYKSKSAGFRTIMLITLGSTIFMLLSRHSGDDRIASTIVTGIGFIGAGVIFKERMWVRGLTTAAVIWVTAAIGMLCGGGGFILAFSLTAVTVVILALFNRLEAFVDRWHARKQLRVTFSVVDLELLHQLEHQLTTRRLRYSRQELSKQHGHLVVVLNLVGPLRELDDLNGYLLSLPEVTAYDLT